MTLQAADEPADTFNMHSFICSIGASLHLLLTSALHLWWCSFSLNPIYSAIHSFSSIHIHRQLNLDFPRIHDIEFCLQYHYEQGRTSLKKEHSYYCQVQGQMAVMYSLLTVSLIIICQGPLGATLFCAILRLCSHVSQFFTTNIYINYFSFPIPSVGECHVVNAHVK